MHSIVVGIMLLVVSIASVLSAQIPADTQARASNSHLPVAHRQPTQTITVRMAAKVRAQPRQPGGMAADHDAAARPDPVESDDQDLTSMIAKENERLARKLKDICRGC
jgi:hypothetical protein